MGLRPLLCLYFLQCGDRLYTSESDVYRRQILTYKDGPRTERLPTKQGTQSSNTAKKNAENKGCKLAKALINPGTVFWGKQEIFQQKAVYLDEESQ